MRSIALFLLAAVSAAPSLAQPAPPATFQSGDTVAIIGDSITHGRKWHRYVYNYYLTRFPDRQVRFVNLGIAGDSAGGAVRRLDWDILPNRPNVAAIFLGMNDVGRGNYAPGEPTEAVLKARQAALDNYAKNMDELSQKLLANGVQRLVFITPSPYDDTADIGENFPGVNGALARCGQIGRELADKYHGSVIDLNGPMTALNLEHQKTDPKFTVIGPDRVHPGDLGMMVIAYYFLIGQNAPALVSRVAIADGKADTANADLTNLKTTDQGLSFDLLEKSLPWPIEASARPALDLVPLEQNLNQQQFAATVPAGTYRLTIDNQPVGDYTAEALKAGLNLALNDKTPQYQQALKVWQTNEQRSALEIRIRTMAQIQAIIKPRGVNEDDPAAAEASFNEWLSRVGESMHPYFKSQFNVYKSTRTDLPNLKQQIETLQQQLWQLNQPQPHHYELTRLP
ncbi:MAG: SGNH/GDSL hydrolase family protein [Armatimonadia bacterium]